MCQSALGLVDRIVHKMCETSIQDDADGKKEEEAEDALRVTRDNVSDMKRIGDLDGYRF